MSLESALARIAELQGALTPAPPAPRQPAPAPRQPALASARGQVFTVTSGHRSIEEQQRLWDNRHSNPYPVAQPGRSRHQSGRAADVTVNGQAIQDVVSDAELRAFGLAPLKGDAVHVELP